MSYAFIYDKKERQRQRKGLLVIPPDDSTAEHSLLNLCGSSPLDIFNNNSTGKGVPRPRYARPASGAVLRHERNEFALRKKDGFHVISPPPLPLAITQEFCV